APIDSSGMAMKRLGLQHLRFVQQVAATGSFTAAAAACGVAQPTVSEGVALVERELGVRLFTRTTRQVTLTPIGAALATRIDAVLGAAAVLEAEAGRLAAGHTGQVRIGVSSVVDLTRLHHLVAPFRAAWPDVEIVYKECTAEDLDERLAAHTCDLAVRVRTRARPGTFVLYVDPLRYVARTGSTAAEIDLATAAALPLVFSVGTCGLAQATRAMFHEAGIGVREVPGQALSYSALEEWALLGVGAAILPESRLGSPLSGLPRIVGADGPAALVIEAVRNPDAVRTEPVTALWRHLRQSARSTR
ncbi:MAG: LysR family transcriptional regulator, partial [Myxococcota bacterium]